MKTHYFYCTVFLLIANLAARSQTSSQPEFFEWTQLAELPPLADQRDALGVAGPFVGVYNNALVVAGGANFPQPVWEQDQVWHDTIWVLANNRENQTAWHDGGRLPHPIAYGASVSTPQGIVCMGGNNSTGTFRDTFIMKWNTENMVVEMDSLPPLPSPCAYGSAAVIGNVIYLAGGSSAHDLKTAMRNFWRLDLSQKDAQDFQWMELNPWPGPERAFNLTVSQHNGMSDCIYVISGRRSDGQDGIVPLTDVYEFTPPADVRAAGVFDQVESSVFWRKRQEVPRCVMAGTAAGVGQSHIFVFGGADGSLFSRADELKEKHPGFPREMLAYHTITDTWIFTGTVPANQATTQIARWGDSLIIAGGEIKPRVRTPVIWRLNLRQNKELFGFMNIAVIALYFIAIILLGIYFTGRNRSTDDFFRGGQRTPWLAAGLSIFATMLSSLTFIAIPAKTYATDWVLILINAAIVINAPFIVYFILPFFRRIDATSAYEYLEKRFNVFVRLFASLSYVLFQIGRMAIVMFLPALAMAAITPFSVESCILIMGIAGIVYCTMGGLEAVVWTDALQSVVLLGGALFSFLIIVFSMDNGLAGFLTTAFACGKFHTINWDWSAGSYAATAFWVVFLGGIGQQLVPYTSDQGIVQRYMSVATDKQAARTIWTNVVVSIPATLLFFSMGTALFVFYRAFPERLDPTFQTDAIFPLFIARELPDGIAGMVVAGIFAAAQSTISTSMNSAAAVIVTDFFRRFQWLGSEPGYLRLARGMTMGLGLLGTYLALLFASADVKSMWDSFMTIIGLFGGAMCGLFLLGIFTRRANSVGAVVGAIAGAVVLALVQRYTHVSYLLYASVGISVTVFVGYMVSLIVPRKEGNLKDLTIYTIDKS
ncbi:MAG: sodium:solute symporter [Candidatus Omnitrophota bacterium]|jgi:SSS family transporter|nr:MAG: sodium:solute symporter [Candidatus Omnitrophota bacterium]